MRAIHFANSGAQHARVYRILVVIALLLLQGLLATAASAATVVVTSLSDNGAGSLRNAVTNANNGDVITFTSGLTGTISVLSTLPVTKNVTITGPGAAALAIDGGNSVGVLSVAAGTTVSISGLTITHGNAGAGSGGGIFNRGTLTLNGVSVTNNTATLGGGINSDAGSLTLTGCTISGNQAAGGAGGGLY
ncbi:MAG: hypothetical protein IJI03_10920, partial [Rudaea sp.]|nr:hypothetical protein [Rudaea sp.]